ncbi:MAG: TetR/AcrR family transcriptional regulator [Tannerella sp.]|jgi:AcrR family transcriptional regulator|nr:TetR/AcrR family transcriptional regulator [Tannerella sp.]
MDRKQIQEQRMKSYFIQAAKDMLKGEGLKSLSVRSVADRAGYSFATLYNYFKDLNELIFVCVKDFQEECLEIVTGKTKKIPDGKEKIKATVMAYISYFLEYPGVFELFFLERMGNIGNKQATSELIYTFLDRLCEEQWIYCLKENMVDSEKVSIQKAQLRFAVMGMLLFYENRLQPESYPEFMKLANQQIDEIISTNDQNQAGK